MAGVERIGPREIGPCAIEARLLALQGRHACGQEGGLVVDIFHRPLELPPQAAGLSQDGADLGLGGLEVGLGADHGRFLDVDLHLVRLAIELDQQGTLLHAVVVVDQDPGHLTGHAGRHERHVSVDVGIIRGDRAQRRLHRGDQEISPDRQAGDGTCPQQPFSPGVRWCPGRGRRRDRRGVGCRVRGFVVRMGSSTGRWRRWAIPRLRRRGPGRSRPCLECGSRILVNHCAHVDVPLSVGRRREEPVTSESRGRHPVVWVISATAAFVRQSGAMNSAPWRCMSCAYRLASKAEAVPARRTSPLRRVK